MPTYLNPCIAMVNHNFNMKLFVHLKRIGLNEGGKQDAG
jgi:hypothetical protein